MNKKAFAVLAVLLALSAVLTGCSAGAKDERLPVSVLILPKF